MSEAVGWCAALVAAAIYWGAVVGICWLLLDVLG